MLADAVSEWVVALLVAATAQIGGVWTAGIDSGLAGKMTWFKSLGAWLPWDTWAVIFNLIQAMIVCFAVWKVSLIIIGTVRGSGTS